MNLLNTLDISITIQRGRKLGYALPVKTRYERTENHKQNEVVDCPNHRDKICILRRLKKIKGSSGLVKSLKSETDDGLSSCSNFLERPTVDEMQSDKAQMRQRKKYDERILLAKPYEVGQFVWVFQNVIPPKGTKKLLKKWRGPFMITEVHQQGRFYRLSTGRAAHYESCPIPRGLVYTKGHGGTRVPTGGASM